MIDDLLGDLFRKPLPRADEHDPVADALTKAVADGILPDPETLLCIRCDEPAVGYVSISKDNPLAVEPRCGACA